VELQQLIIKVLGGKFDFVPVERPYAIKPPEPEQTVSANEIMNFLGGI
jgi:hypothetical protein